MSQTDETSADSAVPAENPVPAAPNEIDDATREALATTKTTINRKWSFKMVAIAAVSLFMAGFFLVDGAIRYPARGADAAEYLEWQYLQTYDKDPNRLGIARIPSIEDPEKTLAQLSERLKATGKIDAVDEVQKLWLENLKLINKLIPDATKIPRKNYKEGAAVESGAQRLESLTKTWTQANGDKRSSPTPLSQLDIPSQWVGMAVSGVIGLWVIFIFLQGCRRSYRWNPEKLELTLPDGSTLVPADIAEVDKRKWDKLYVSLRIRDQHPTLGGKSVEFDLLRYEPLEAWILHMERTAFPPAAES
jgi:hypothetical protein